ncbi:hypothetical protein Gasu2_09650 [Galdieria sulphuraria]|uniref:Uncharacterized protein n=1 Tax=Galdieria sulphuraria TaxID=130081 RepID=M2W6L6_GALSU|nr:uncharacterized protein Gasu_13650 [Galdieria sulphuraria]EME31401.1 hypothetical protein Gasu_13650 [Galdieria sulphuraria]GJD06555.1 hypothetical protein Gasu2_09650 [Galdieria sulphuraria]|eukprot:XP_005707921.1 hypothetical protein Gasu_13650 [Galdieria sulphuraria]
MKPLHYIKEAILSAVTSFKKEVDACHCRESFSQPPAKSLFFCPLPRIKLIWLIKDKPSPFFCRLLNVLLFSTLALR